MHSVAAAQPAVDLNRFDVEFVLQADDDRAYRRALESNRWGRLWSFDDGWAVWFFVLILPFVVILLTQTDHDLGSLLKRGMFWLGAGIAGLATITRVAVWVLPYVTNRYSRHRVTIDQFGFVDRTPTGSVSAGWDDVRSVNVLEHCIAIEYRRSRWHAFNALLLIPMRAFNSYAEHQAFLAACQRCWATR